MGLCEKMKEACPLEQLSGEHSPAKEHLKIEVYTLRGCSGTVPPFSITCSAMVPIEPSCCKSLALERDLRFCWTLAEACSHHTVARAHSCDLEGESSLRDLEAL